MDKRKSQTIRLAFMLILTFSFFVVELVVGYVTGSLALVSDSYHMLSDFIALCIGLACVRISHWNSTKNTYGWVRTEILGALVNSVFLIALCFTILTDAITRLINPEGIRDVDLLLYVGIAGLVINVVGLIMFCSDVSGGHHGHSHGSGGGHGHSHGSGGGHGHSHGAKKKHKSHETESTNKLASESNNKLAQAPANGHANGHAHSNGSVGYHEHEHEHDTKTADDDIVPNGDIESPENELRKSTEPEEDAISRLSYLQEAAVIKTGSQMNMLGVFLHVLGDALGSIVVIVSALVVKFVEADWVDRVDPAMSIIMTIIILSTTIPLLKQSAMVLLQTVPTHIKISELSDKLLQKVHEILGLHEFHVWQLTGNRIVASGHIRIANLSDYSKVALKVKTFFHNEGIHSTTFQPEFNESFEDLTNNSRDCVLECGPDKTCFENTCCSNKFKDKDGKPLTLTQSGTNPSFQMVDETNRNSNVITNPAYEVPSETNEHPAVPNGDRTAVPNGTTAVPNGDTTAVPNGHATTVPNGITAVPNGDTSTVPNDGTTTDDDVATV